MRNFKFTAFATILLLLLAFAFSPPNVAASAVTGIENQAVYSPGQNAVKVSGVTVNLTQASVYRFIRNDEPKNQAQMTAQSLRDAPDDVVCERNYIFDTTFTIDRLTEIIPPQINFKDTGQYVSRDRNLTIKPPKNAFSHAKPEIVMLR